ncbi:MAG TPA: protein kinase [Gemmatimonadaceae bacterium]|nr:protein kinase [Gemmatimonadaceae bacterium]
MSTQTERLTVALAGQYRIERHLGEGGMATVYLAHDLKHDRKVAVKVLRPELAAVLGAERFVQEIKTTAALQHPHILPLFDSGRTTGGDDGGTFLYYVMPYVEGETLRDKLKRDTQLGIDEAVRLTGDVADALDYAHRHGVIHRDIKPENILLHDGRPVVADFGIALAVSAAAGGRMTETGLSLGTPFYMSPEQATADKELTARSDIYSLGCVLYEMLTGEPPHTGATAQAIVMKILTDDARPVTDLRRSVPPHVAAATAKALEKLPADRFETAHAFADALKDARFTAQTHAHTSARGALAAQQRRSYAPLLAAATLVFAAIAAWGWTRSPAMTAPTIAYRARIPLPIENGLGNDFGSQIAISPDGSKLVYATAEDGTPKLWMLNRNELAPKIIPGTEQAHQPFFSPDGSKVAFLTWDRRLKVISLTGEPPTTLVDTGIVRGGGAWGEDGYIYLSGGSRETGVDNRGILRVAERGGQLERVSSLDSSTKEIVHNQPVWLPGGRGLVVTVQHDVQYDASKSEIAVIDIRTHKHTKLLEGIIARWSPTGHLIVVRADGALVAAPFDPKSLKLTGPATPLLEGVDVEVLATSDIALSNNGTLIYAMGGGGSRQFEPVWITRDGKVTAVDPDWQGPFRNPAVSADGKLLALTVAEAENHIWIKQLDHGPFSKLTFDGRNNARPAWMGLGHDVLFTSDSKGVLAAFAKRADGSAPATQVFSAKTAVNEVEWSRDGAWAVARINSAPIGDIVAWRPGKDTVAVAIVTTKFDEVEPSLSPDAKFVAYASNESGQYEIYVRPFPDASSAKWQVSRKGGREPVWSHSGHELFFRDSQNRMAVVQRLPGVAFAMSEEKVLFTMAGIRSGENHRSYDVAPDDQRFIAIRSQAGAVAGDTPLVVVDNFFAELRQKLGKK